MVGFGYLSCILAKTTRLHGKAALGLVQLGVDCYQTLLVFRFYISEVVKEVEQGSATSHLGQFSLAQRLAPATEGSSC